MIVTDAIPITNYGTAIAHMNGIPAGGVFRARVKIRYHDGGTMANITEGDGEIV